MVANPERIHMKTKVDRQIPVKYLYEQILGIRIRAYFPDDGDAFIEFIKACKGVDFNLTMALLLHSIFGISHRKIAELFNISQSQAARWEKKGKKQLYETGGYDTLVGFCRQNPPRY